MANPCCIRASEDILPLRSSREKTPEQWKTFVFLRLTCFKIPMLYEAVPIWNDAHYGRKTILFHVERFPVWAGFPKCFTWNIPTPCIYNSFNILR